MRREQWVRNGSRLLPPMFANATSSIFAPPKGQNFVIDPNTVERIVVANVSRTTSSWK